MNLEILGILIAIVGILMTALVAYYIAHKEGVFRRANLVFSLGMAPELADLDKPIWAILYPIPPMPVKYYVVMLPYLLLSKGNRPVRDIWVQIGMPSGRGPLRIKGRFPDLHNNINFPGIERRIRPLGDFEIVHHEMPLIREEEHVVGGEMMVYLYDQLYPNSKSELNELEFADGELIIDSVHVQVMAENHPKIKWQGYFVAVPCHNIEQLRERFSQITQVLIEHESGVLVRGVKLVWSRLWGSPIAGKECLLVRPDFVRIGKDIAIEASLVGERLSGYQPATADIVLTGSLLKILRGGEEKV